MHRRRDPIIEHATTVAYQALAAASLRESRWVTHVQARGGLRDSDASSPGPGLFAGVQWTVPFVAFVAYILAITTYRLPIGSVAIIAGLAGLLLQSEPRRFPGMLAWFAAFILWCAIGYVASP